MKELNTAVLFLIFNRIEPTQKVFSAIRDARPPRLYIAADGARDAKRGEVKDVEDVRNYVINHIDWECEVFTLFREKNLGCKYAVSGAINWFFEQEEMGIVLEDDCLPSRSFFYFCEELLNKYQDDTRVMKVSGYNLLSEEFRSDADYVFTHFGFAWGWASWRRAWQHFDVEMKKWPLVRDSYISKTYPFEKDSVQIYDDTYNGEIDTWDYQWDFTITSNYAFSLVPIKSLVQNIGFGADATHTFDNASERAEILANEIDFPLRHPELIFRNSDYEKVFWAKIKSKPHIIKRIKSKFKKILSRNNTCG